eukprot:scaffold3607_cov114-Isochrysis_galbana.AAC.29
MIKSKSTHHHHDHQRRRAKANSKKKLTDRGSQRPQNHMHPLLGLLLSIITFKWFSSSDRSDAR